MTLLSYHNNWFFLNLLTVSVLIFSLVETPMIASSNTKLVSIDKGVKWIFDLNVNTVYASTSNLTSDSSKANILDTSAIIVAIISLISAAFVVILTYIFNVKQNRELTEQNRHLEVLKSRLEAQKDQKAAKTDYEYEARKNLYVQFEPLLFQLHELSHRAYERITQIVEDFRRGNLSPNGGWLSDRDGFYFTMTLYLLLAPVGIFYLMSRRLTQFDLQLDPFYNNQFLLSKLVYRTFSHDYKLASYEPKIDDYLKHYNPDNASLADPYNAFKQGIDSELLDQAAQAFTIRDPLDNIIRIKTFGEFYKEWKRHNTTEDNDFDFKQLEYLIKDFHPESRTVLWRILIAQAYIYQLLIDNYLSDDAEDLSEKIPIMNSYEEQMKLFDWRNDEDKTRILDDVVMKPLTAVKEYLKNDVAADYIKYRGHRRAINIGDKAHE